MQERDAATRFIKNVFPNAEVRAKVATDACEGGTNRVIISSGGRELVAVEQRDLFSKYGWPAEQEITDAMTQFKDAIEK